MVSQPGVRTLGILLEHCHALETQPQLLQPGLLDLLVVLLELLELHLDLLKLIRLLVVMFLNLRNLPPEIIHQMATCLELLYQAVDLFLQLLSLHLEEFLLLALSCVGLLGFSDLLVVGLVGFL